MPVSLLQVTPYFHPNPFSHKTYSPDYCQFDLGYTLPIFRILSYSILDLPLFHSSFFSILSQDPGLSIGDHPTFFILLVPILILTNLIINPCLIQDRIHFDFITDPYQFDT